MPANKGRSDYVTGRISGLGPVNRTKRGRSIMGIDIEVTLKARVQQDGNWWDFSIRKMYRASGYSGLTDQIKADIAKMSKAGCISTASFPMSPGAKLDEPVVNQEMKNGSAGWPVPQCLFHQTEMMLSKVQKKPGKIRYYCPKKLDDGYCARRCDVGEETGVPDHWEVRS